MGRRAPFFGCCAAGVFVTIGFLYDRAVFITNALNDFFETGDVERSVGSDGDAAGVNPRLYAFGGVGADEVAGRKAEGAFLSASDIHEESRAPLGAFQSRELRKHSLVGLCPVRT